jgi:50S ribosomal protein L16 3-hydroxylase
MNSFYLSKPYQPPVAPRNLPLDQPWALFGNISPERFMTRYWHKKPLLIRGAIPAFSTHQKNPPELDSPISAPELFALAGNEFVESRLIQSKPWSLKSGPFKKKALPKIDQANWTLLLQGMEAHHPAAAAVLSWFRFIPDARLDDLMISIAGLGGGVGPHFDSYDVFLIQMSGRRQWRISSQKDLSLDPQLPLKILQNFAAEQDWVLEPGDMLYLPPHIAHDGIALDAGCQTWSVGFRSPSFKELLQEGLWRLAESLEEIPGLEEKFADPKQNAIRIPEELPKELIKQLEIKLAGLKLDQIDGFLPGITAYLTEPKQHAYFRGPKNPLSPKQFAQKLSSQTLKPHPQSRLLSLDHEVYCNGEIVTKGQAKEIQEAWRSIAANKALTRKKSLKGNAGSSLYDAYLSGWIILQST